MSYACLMAQGVMIAMVFLKKVADSFGDVHVSTDVPCSIYYSKICVLDYICFILRRKLRVKIKQI